MLPKNIWNEWEPRVSFPIFGDCQNSVDFAVQDSLNDLTLKAIAGPAVFWWWKQKSLKCAVRNYRWLLLNEKIKFRGVLLSRQGEFIKQWKFDGVYGRGDFFSVNINQLMKESGVQAQDGMFTLIASRGRNDRWNSSPGNVSVRYVSDKFVSGYRTGFFARPLNNGKGHFGFTGINPQVIVNRELTAGILLQNHSSDPNYAQTVNPTVRLYRNGDEYIEAPFGEIAPHGAREVDLAKLFPQAEEFLAPNEGRGYTITKVKGVTLASIHILRSRENGLSVGMDHSRPSHAAVVDYLKKPKAH